MPQPHVMTIQPLCCAFDCASSTAATTPSPSKIRSAVPMISAGKMSTCSPPLLRGSRRADGPTLVRSERQCQTPSDIVRRTLGLPTPLCPYVPGVSRRLCRTRRHSVKARSLVVIIDPVQRALDCFAPLAVPLLTRRVVHRREPLARLVPVVPQRLD